MTKEIDNSKRFILRELIKRKIIGGKHTPLDRVTKNLPDEFLQQKSTIKKALKELRNDGWVILPQKRTGKGSDLHISINPRAWKEIGNFLNLPKRE